MVIIRIRGSGVRSVYIRRLLGTIIYKLDCVCLYQQEDCRVISKFISHVIAVVLCQQIEVKRICRRLRCTLNIIIIIIRLLIERNGQMT